MAMNAKLQRVLLLTSCVVEMGVFGGVMAGWRHMANLFKGDGLYDTLCNKTSLMEPQELENWYEAHLCKAQENKMELSLALSSVLRALACMVATKMLGTRGEGMRFTRLSANLQIFTGGLLFFYANKRIPALSFWGAVFVNTGSGQLLCANLFVANLFSRFRCFILGLMFGAYVFSENIFNMFETVPPSEPYPWQSVCYAWTLSSMLMTVPTFGLLTFQRRFKGRDRTYSFGDDILLRSNSEGEPRDASSSQANDINGLDASEKVCLQYGVSHNTKIICEEVYGRRLSSARRVATPLLSTPYLLLVCWAAVIQLTLAFHENSFQWTLALLVKNEIDASQYVKAYDSTPMSALFVAPLVGLILDFLINFHSKNERTVRNASAAALSTTVMALWLIVSRSSGDIRGLQTSVHLRALTLPLFQVVSTVIIKCWFPRSEFQKLFSFNIFVSTWFCMLRYPLVAWDKENSSHATTALVMLLGSSLVINVWLVMPRRWLFSNLRNRVYRQ